MLVNGFKWGILVCLLIVYWHPIPVLKTLINDPILIIHVNIMRFIMTSTTWLWAISTTTNYILKILIILCQALCWMTFITDKPILVHLWNSGWTKTNEKIVFERGDILLYGCLMYLLFFHQLTMKEMYR